MSKSATPATQNDMTTCLETFVKEMFCSFPHRQGDVSRKPETLRHVIKQLGMSQSGTPATQNDMTTCLETFEKERFCSFPHRHGDATGKPATQDKTRGCRKISISYETSSNFYIFRHVIKQVGMSQSATPATQNDMTTCLDTFEKDRVSSFPHRHGDATGKPATRDSRRDAWMQ